MADSPQAEAVSMELVAGSNRQSVVVDHSPFVIGRSSECDLTLDQPYVSRVHARITFGGAHCVVEDCGSRHGTFVNGEQVDRCALQPGDKLQFGSQQGPYLRYRARDSERGSGQTILAQLHGISAQQSDLEKLRWFLQAAQELNRAGKVDRVLTSLLETTLALAKVERGYVFLTTASGALELALGMDAAGDTLTDTSTVSRTVMRQATRGADQFIVTDSMTAEGQLPESVIPHSIHTIICIPLRRKREPRAGEDPDDTASRQVFGALYLESRFRPGGVSDVDHELMRTIAREAAALVDNAQLAAIEEQARKHQEELQIAARIQQGLMTVQIPVFPFAGVQAHSMACSAVGGDFFDVVSGQDVLNVAVVDVSGKGISAAILASTLQGMLHVQLEGGRPLQTIAAATNRYLCQKDVGKYATMVLLRLHEDGTLEYLNCGHVQPRMCSDAGVSRLEGSNLPIGLVAEAEYTSGIVTLDPGSRIVLVSDGFTEAEDAHGEFFGDDRFDSAALCADLTSVLAQMAEFCAGYPANDDCTIVQVAFSGSASQPGDANLQPLQS